MIRVFAKYRNIRTISEVVQQYVPIKDYTIQIPSTEDIKASSVVVTTLATSHRLVSSELQGHFTHILIDEAGQALETEVLQPLTLATGDTCVVLAGDHIQMSQKVRANVETLVVHTVSHSLGGIFVRDYILSVHSQLRSYVALNVVSQHCARLNFQTKVDNFHEGCDAVKGLTSVYYIFC